MFSLLIGKLQIALTWSQSGCLNPIRRHGYEGYSVEYRPEGFNPEAGGMSGQSDAIYIFSSAYLQVAFETTLLHLASSTHSLGYRLTLYTDLYITKRGQVVGKGPPKAARGEGKKTW